MLNASSPEEATSSSTAMITVGHEEDSRLLELVTAVYLCLLAVLGAVGNGLVVAAVVRLAQMRRLTYILVGNLSAVGLLHCLLLIPLHVHHTLTGGGPWARAEGRDAACKAQAHVNYGLTLCTLLNSAAIAVSRHRAVTSTHSLRGHTTSRSRALTLLFFFWALPMLVACSALPFLGFNGFLCDCFFQVTESALWFTSVALAAPALVSTGCMLTTYALIIKKVRASRLKIASLYPKVASMTDNIPGTSREEKTISESEVPPAKTDRQASNPGRKSTGSSNIVGIEIYTTMVPDEFLSVPSTSFAVHSPEHSFLGKSEAPDAEEQEMGDRSHLSASQPSSSGARPMAEIVAIGGEESGEARDERADPTERNAAGEEGEGRMETLSVPLQPVSKLSGRPDFSISSSQTLPSFCSYSSRLTSAEQTSDSMKAGSEGKKNLRFRREVRLTLNLFLAFVLFCLLYLPLCLAHALHALHALGKEAWLVFYTLALSFSSNSWLVYAHLNRDFRHAFRALLQGRRSF